MDKETILARLCEIVDRTSRVKVDTSLVNEKAGIDSLGIDSLSIFDFIFEIQEEFEITFEPTEFLREMCVGDIIAMIEERMPHDARQPGGRKEEEGTGHG